MRRKLIQFTTGMVLSVSLILQGCLTLPASADAITPGTVSTAGTPDTAGLQMISKIQTDNGSGHLTDSYVDGSGHPVYLDTSSDTAKTGSLKKAANLPSSYSLVDAGLSTSIKDQGVTGACWAFAAIKAAESNSIKSGLTALADTDFSENHLCWFTYHPDTRSSSPIYNDGMSLKNTFSDTVYSCGGNALMSVCTLAAWIGTEKEEAAPFTADTQSEENAMGTSMQANADLLREDSYAHLQNANCYDNASVADIKQALLDTGALNIAMYYDNAGFKTNGQTGTSYFQTEYTDKQLASAISNHCVTIVGWDDNYSRTNFKTQPPADGAWLIANSYGPTYNDNGYFWLSYLEPSICEIYSYQMESPDNYDHNYQYDGGGWNYGFNLTNAGITGANVFQADKTYNQTLDAVSFYTITDAQSYTIQVYRYLNGSAPSSGSLVSQCTTTGTAKYNGYHTVKLKKSCNISAGEKFAVAVTYHYTAATGNQALLPCEGQTKSYANNVTFNAASKEKQSFMYLNGSWEDTSELNINNICIKAFTRDTTAPITPLSGSKNKKITLGKGETYTLSQNSSSQYQTNDTYVAKVSSTGKITASHIGKTVIGIKKKNAAAFSSTITVTVKKAPSRLTTSPSKKKSLKRGKSFTIKPKLPSGSASNKITFSSSKKKVATVTANGKVTAKRKGKTVITVKTFNKKKAKITVTVR